MLIVLGYLNSVSIIKEYYSLMHAVLGLDGIQLIAFIRSPICVVLSTLPVVSPSSFSQGPVVIPPSFSAIHSVSLEN